MKRRPRLLAILFIDPDFDLAAVLLFLFLLFASHKGTRRPISYLSPSSLIRRSSLFLFLYLSFLLFFFFFSLLLFLAFIFFSLRRLLLSTYISIFLLASLGLFARMHIGPRQGMHSYPRQSLSFWEIVQYYYLSGCLFYILSYYGNGSWTFGFWGILFSIYPFLLFKYYL